MQAHSLSPLPRDLIIVLAALIPETGDVVKLKLVSKFFKSAIDKYITSPKYAANIIFSLSPPSSQFLIFIEFYSETEAAIKLREKVAARVPLNVFERICFAHAMGGIECRYSKEEVFEVINELSFNAVKNFLVPFDANTKPIEQCFKVKLAELKVSATLTAEKEDFRNIILSMLIRGLAHGNSYFNVHLYERAIELCNQYQLSNKHINRCIESLRITIAANRSNKTAADYELIRGGFNGYINLHKIDLRNAPLRNARLSNVRLSWCNFSGADLRDADFENTVFDMVIFIGADLRNANFHNTKWIDIPKDFTSLEKLLLDAKSKFDDLATRIKINYGRYEVQKAIAQNILRIVKKHQPDVAIQILNIALESKVFDFRQIPKYRLPAWALFFWQTPEDSPNMLLQNGQAQSNSANLLHDELKRLQAESRVVKTFPAT